MKYISIFKKPDFYLIMAIIIYPLLFVWGGIEFSDTGTTFYYYKQIFNNPNVILDITPTILTSIIGGLWIKIFCFMEYTSCKLGYALVIILINFLMFKILKDIFKNKTMLLLTLLLSTICITHLDCCFLNYPVLTVLFFILGVYFLYYGIINKSKLKIFISSMIFALNISIRFPNILGIFFIFIPFIWNFFKKDEEENKKEDFKDSLKNSMIFLSGYLLTLIIFILCLKFAGILNFYFEGFKYWHSPYPDDHHSVYVLLNRYIETYSKALLLSINFIGIFYFFNELIHNRPRYKIYIISLIPVLVVFQCINSLTLRILPDLFNYFPIFSWPVISIYQLFSEDFYQKLGYYLFLGIFLFIPIFILFDKKANNKLRFMCLLGMLITAFSLAGSYWYFLNGYWFLISISIYYILNLEIFDKFKKTGLSLIVFLLIFTIFTKTGWNDYAGTMDLKTIITNHKFMNNNMFRGSFTTRERADAINNFIEIYPDYIKQGDSLLAWPNLPLMYSITNTKPVLGTPWPDLIDYRIFNEKLAKIEKNKKFPVILESKYNVNFKPWPKRVIPNVYENNIKDCSVYSTDICTRNQCEAAKNIYIFTEKYKYSKVWENEVFVIYRTYAK